MPGAARPGKFFAISPVHCRPPEMLLGAKCEGSGADAQRQSGWECRAISNWNFKHSTLAISFPKPLHCGRNGVLRSAKRAKWHPFCHWNQHRCERPTGVGGDDGWLSLTFDASCLGYRIVSGPEAVVAWGMCSSAGARGDPEPWTHAGLHGFHGETHGSISL